MERQRDEYWMQRALDLAVHGQGLVEPNPMVGAVVLDSLGEFVSEGWHQKFGEAHAEVNALVPAGNRAKGGTLYVTLEPCSHHGKTPPCTDAVLLSGVNRVVVAMADPFPKVAGSGLEILRQAGIELTIGVCEAQAMGLNAPYLKRLRTGQPWVHLKWAMTLDGKIATSTGDSKWISSEASRAVVHSLRGRMDAIIVGKGTVFADDPMLTARPAGSRQATRVVLAGSGVLPERCQLKETASVIPVLIYTEQDHIPLLRSWTDAGAEVVGLPCQGSKLSISEILHDLGRRAMTNVLVEGGAGLLGSFLDSQMIDEAHVFVAPKLFGGVGALSPIAGLGFENVKDAIHLRRPVVTRCDQDVYITSRVRGTP